MKYKDPMVFDDPDLQIVFKPLDAFGINPEFYQISNYGHIYSTRYDRLLKPQISTHGYYQTACGADHRIFNHRGVAAVFVDGYSEEKNCVNHKNGKKLDDYYKNLEWVSKAENNTHAYKTGLNNCIGENCRSAKLTNDQAERICQLLQDGYEIYPILEIMGMEPTMNNYEIIRSIRKGYAWKRISSKYNIQQSSYHYRSISKDIIHRICKNFENGMSIPECYEDIYKKPFPGIDNCKNEYIRLMDIKCHNTFKEISSQYNF